MKLVKLPMKLRGLDALGSFGLVGERKAIALLFLGFYATLFFLIGMAARTEIPEWVPVFIGMMAIYLTAFMAVGAEWFWGRWFATGIGYWGMTMAAMAFVSTRTVTPPLLMLGIMHALIAACLAGEKMAARFDAKPEWRARWKLDDQGVIRVRKSVTRAASSLPALIMFALAPREPAGMLLFALAAVGTVGLLTARTWGLFALGAAGIASLAAAVLPQSAPMSLMTPSVAPALFAGFAGVLLCGAVLPFITPMLGYLRRRS